MAWWGIISFVGTPARGRSIISKILANCRQYKITKDEYLWFEFDSLPSTPKSGSSNMDGLTHRRPHQNLFMNSPMEQQWTRLRNPQKATLHQDLIHGGSLTWRLVLSCIYGGRGGTMKETLRRRITVTSSLNEISTDHLRNGDGGEALLLPPPPLFTGFLDDVNGFSSMNICFMGAAQLATQREIWIDCTWLPWPRVFVYICTTQKEMHTPEPVGRVLRCSSC